MTSKGRQPAQPQRGAKAGPPPQSGSLARGLRGLVIEQALGATLGRFVKLIAAVVLGAAGLFLTIAWQAGPQRVFDAVRDSKLTARTEGRIVESWLAVELDPRDIGQKTRWRTFARATPCAVVEYRGDWGAPARRAFCGNRFTFSDEYTLHDLREMAPRIPFAWARDESGFILPEIRIAPGAREWLASHPARWLLPNDPPAATALEGLRQQLDRPVDDAVAGWSAPSPSVTVAVDPKHPDAALPAGLLQTRHDPNWAVFIMAAIPGLLLWYEGMAILFGDLPRIVGYVLLALPLVFLPWWGERFPRYLRHLHGGFAGVIADMIGDIDPLGRFVACDPAAATLADGERMVWRARTGSYADTFGRFQFTRPDPALSADDAVVALASTIAVQARALSESERVALFQRLERDKVKELRRAGLVFMAAAREAVLDDGDDAVAVRRAASRFLEEWFNEPSEPLGPRDLGYQGRLKLYAAMADLPMPGIASTARAISGGVGK
jgi:hypothetical protein